MSRGQCELIAINCTETNFYANDVLKTCHSIGVINKETGQPDTTKIDRSMVSKIAIISVPKQRELVNMLFFWEEECTRWRLLEQEEASLVERMGIDEVDGGEKIHLEESLKIVRAKKRVVPSLRDEAGKTLGTEDLPGYSR